MAMRVALHTTQNRPFSSSTGRLTVATRRGKRHVLSFRLVDLLLYGSDYP